MPVVAAVERGMRFALRRHHGRLSHEVLDMPWVFAPDVRDPDAREAGGELLGKHQRLRFLNCVAAPPAISPPEKRATRIIAARPHWKGLSGVSGPMPIPPAPTKPSTAD